MRAGEQQGFTYVWLLMTVAVLAIGLSVIGPRWSDDARREREGELLRIGALYAKAITAYYASTPGAAKAYPARLDDLLSDTRMVGTVRHLRKLYADPLNEQRPWGVVRDAAGGIRGVYSQSNDAPLRVETVNLAGLSLPAAQRYSDWKFVAEPLQ